MTTVGQICTACGHPIEEHLAVGCIVVTEVDRLGYVKDTCACQKFEQDEHQE